MPDKEIFNWLVNVQEYAGKIPRSLLFARNDPNSQKYSIPILELETALQQESQGKKGELNYLSTMLFIVLVMNWIS